MAASASEADVVRLFETIDATLGTIGGLVNNEGILERQMRVEHIDAAQFAAMREANADQRVHTRLQALRDGSDEGQFLEEWTGLRGCQMMLPILLAVTCGTERWILETAMDAAARRSATAQTATWCQGDNR